MHWIYAHLIGDYLIQNDWMAMNKKKSSLACTVHVATYMIPFAFCGFRWWQIALIALQHWLVDRTQFISWFMRVKGSSNFSNGVCFPWSDIVVDNISHIIWIALIASL